MAKKFIEYYDIAAPPLLLQGFDQQSVVAGVINQDTKVFTTEVNRGIVDFLDYSTTNLAIITGQDENNWNDGTVSLEVGGQEMLVDAPLERFDYNIDLGNQKEQRIKTWVNGGQTIKSTLNIDPTTLAPIPNIQTQLHAYYTTKKLNDWRAQFQWNNGAGLKRQGYKLTYGILPDIYKIDNVLPKNQGSIVGFSLLYLGLNAFEGFIDLEIDGIKVLTNVAGERFSRYNQLDPYVFKLPLNPGSTFELILDQKNTTGNPGTVFIEFYFNN